MPRIDSLLRAARTHLAAEAADAPWLLAHVAGQTQAWLYAHGDERVDPEVQERFAALVARRSAGEPVAYLIGSCGFWGLQLQVTPDTLIPRPETERLVELALARLSLARAVRIADLGTGSGAICLALALERPDVKVIATDASAAALVVARANAARLGIVNVDFRQGHWLQPLAGERLDMLVANPPYIAAADPHLRQGDLRYEPWHALASGDDGLDAIQEIVREAPAHLLPGGWLLLEHGWEQAEAVRVLLVDTGLIDVGTHRDIEGRDRVTLARSL